MMMALRLLIGTPLVALLVLGPAPAQPVAELPAKAPADRLDGPPIVSAKAWAVADAATGRLVGGDHEAEPRPIASTTKIMTALLVLRLAADNPAVLDEVVTYSDRAAHTSGSSAKIKAGERLPVRELLYGLLLPSGNDAAVALAEHFGPRFAADPAAGEDAVRRFVAEMNRRAKALGLKETSYVDPNGLGQNLSSPRDLAALARHALADERFREYVRTRRHRCEVVGPDGQKRTASWDNTNKLLDIDGYDGVKTGTTNAAGACLVASGHRGTDHLLVVVLGGGLGDQRYADVRNLFRWGWLRLGHAATAGAGRAKDEPAFTRTEDVIYGRKHGTALTLDVFTPKQSANGAAVIWVVSGGWFSRHEAIGQKPAPAPVRELVGRGYTVFAVVHGSQPKFTIPDILDDMHRAVRFIRTHAADYKIDPDRIGITGGSAGGHLSLMQGTAGDAGNPKAADPVDRASSRVRAVACFFPPTDFLNYGNPGENAVGRGRLKDFIAAFDFHEFDPRQKKYVPITDEEKIMEIGRQISPITHVTADDPPTLIIHGDKDQLVPIQQAESFVAKCKEVGVPAELVVKPGASHGWRDMDNDWAKIADWFDKYLKKE
jgi:D-alanyl-D-alanine carboxypeptidase